MPCFAPLVLSSDWIFSRMVPSDPLEDLTIFGVSQGVPTDPHEEVMILNEVFIFSTHSGPQLTRLRKCSCFPYH